MSRVVELVVYIADDKVWDAFVSYKSSGSDEDFVLNKLQPVLEDKFGFRLCLHYRDFVIGAGTYFDIQCPPKDPKCITRTPTKC